MLILCGSRCNRHLTTGIMSNTALFRVLRVKGGTHPIFVQRLIEVGDRDSQCSAWLSETLGTSTCLIGNCVALHDLPCQQNARFVDSAPGPYYCQHITHKNSVQQSVQGWPQVGRFLNCVISIAFCGKMDQLSCQRSPHPRLMVWRRRFTRSARRRSWPVTISACPAIPSFTRPRKSPRPSSSPASSIFTR
jgi:hypothetical protein